MGFFTVMEPTDNCPNRGGERAVTKDVVNGLFRTETQHTSAKANPSMFNKVIPGQDTII